jgi:hypothetical protein
MRAAGPQASYVRRKSLPDNELMGCVALAAKAPIHTYGRYHPTIPAVAPAQYFVVKVAVTAYQRIVCDSERSADVR